MGASWLLPSVASLTGRSVCSEIATQFDEISI